MLRLLKSDFGFCLDPQNIFSSKSDLFSCNLAMFLVSTKDCRDTRLTLNKMIQQKKGNHGSSTLTENNPLDVWDEDCEGAVLP